MSRRATAGRTLAALTASLLLAATDVAAQSSSGGSSGGSAGGSAGSSTGGSTGGTGAGSLTGPSTRTGPSVGPSATQPGGPSPQRLPGPASTPGNNEQFAPRPGATSPTITGPTPPSQQPGGGIQSGTTTQPNLPSTGGSRALNRTQGAAQGGAAGQAGQGGERSPAQGSEMSFEDCVRTWSPETHMSRDQFEDTCRRVQARDREVEKR